MTHEAPETLENLRRENRRLRETLSRVATNIGNGAFAAPECSLDFFDSVAEEVRLVTTDLRRERDEARASVAWMRDQVGKCTGMFAPRHVCEPIEGFAERPQDLPRCINALLDRLRCAEAVAEAAAAVMCPTGGVYAVPQLTVPLRDALSDWRKLTETRDEPC